MRKVAFLSGSQSIGEADAPPYTFAWQNVPVGRHAVKAVVYDTKGAETPSPTRWISAGPVGRLKVEWEPAIEGFWQLSGATNGTERLREARGAEPGNRGRMAARPGWGWRRQAPDEGWRLRPGKPPKRGRGHRRAQPPSSSPAVEIVIDPGAFTSWSQLATCETDRMTGLRRLRVVPGPDFLLQLGDGNELRFGVSTDGTIFLPMEEARFKAGANTLTWTGGQTRP